ncbi:hypothetical protein STEG23_034150 [Scotinomys teguina]
MARGGRVRTRVRGRGSDHWEVGLRMRTERPGGGGGGGSFVWFCRVLFRSKVPAFVRMIAPEGSLVFHEKAWNAYPYCRTIVTNEYMKDDFFIKIETWHKPDLGTLENVHGLDPNTWKTVEIVHIDIADRSQVEPADYKADEDPALFQSVKTKRGPLGPNWKKELANTPDCPKMCAYKLVTIKFKWWGLQSKVENFIQKQEKRIFTNLHRQLFCWIDKWIDLTMEDIRRMEDETQKELETHVVQEPLKPASHHLGVLKQRLWNQMGPPTQFTQR